MKGLFIFALKVTSDSNNTNLERSSSVPRAAECTQQVWIVQTLQDILRDLPGRASFSDKNGLSEGMVYGGPSSLFSISTRSALPSSVDLSDTEREGGSVRKIQIGFNSIFLFN